MTTPLPPFGTGAQGEATARIGKYDATQGGAEAAAEYDLAIALNYGQATGSAQLMRWVTEHTELVCNPPYADWRTCLTVGSTGALEQALRMFCDRGDGMLTEEFSFATAIETAAPLGIPVFGVPMDLEQGLLPEAMDHMLARWDPAARGGAARPRLPLHRPQRPEPHGRHPGRPAPPRHLRRMPPPRRLHPRGRALLLPADGAVPRHASPAGRRRPRPRPRGLPGQPDPVAAEHGHGRPRHAHGLVQQGAGARVAARLDHGLGADRRALRPPRRGVQSGPQRLLPGRPAQAADESWWGHDGYLRWLMHLRSEYTGRRDVMLAACHDFLPLDIVSWSPPRAGMFVSFLRPLSHPTAESLLADDQWRRPQNQKQQHWLKVNHELHPDAATRTILDLEDEIFNLCIENGVLVGRGSWFMADQNRPPTGLYFRATFAAATPPDMTEAIRRFGAAVRRCYRLE